MLHKTRDLLVRQRTMLINALRGHLGEFGIVAAQGAAGVEAAKRALREDPGQLPELAQLALMGLAAQLDRLTAEIANLERRILIWHRQDEVSQRLASIPGIGPITASAMAASAPDPSLFRSGRRGAASVSPEGVRRSLDPGASRSQEAEGRRRGARQQDGAHRLGADVARGELPPGGGLEIGDARSGAEPRT
jgi:transposase